MMTQGLDAALANLSWLRRETMHAEERGAAPLYLVDQMGTLANSLRDAGADTRYLQEAGELWDRVLKLRMEMDR